MRLDFSYEGVYRPYMGNKHRVTAADMRAAAAELERQYATLTEEERIKLIVNAIVDIQLLRVAVGFSSALFPIKSGK